MEFVGKRATRVPARDGIAAWMSGRAAMTADKSVWPITDAHVAALQHRLACHAHNFSDKVGVSG